MKIQGLAIIFIIIILPISIIIGEYARTQKEIFELENLYDTRLITATDDALKAFQINTFNDVTSDIVDSKISSIEASANAFYNSMEVGFKIQGYSKEDLQSYVPALVYTMYDGYYIYSPYTNIADLNTTKGELTVNINSTEKEYGFKPYVYYSCRYKIGTNSDFIINYSLDNYITIQGEIDGEHVYKSGYLVTIASSKSDLEEGLYKETGKEKYYYNNIEIAQEGAMQEYIVETDGTLKQYKYIKLNGTKYYWDEANEYIFYISSGNRIKQVDKKSSEATYISYINQINNNSSAINYYKNAYEFSNWVNNNNVLNKLTPSNAVSETSDKSDSTSRIFDNKKIEYDGSNFNSHRKQVIRYSIESNLSAAIANFNSYTSSVTNFQMPKLKETDWELLENEVSIISFLQGLNLGGKIYNGYTVVTNSKTKEVVKPERIYIITSDEYYHKINDKHLQTGEYEANIQQGVLDLDFEIRKDGATGLSYVHRKESGCYTSIVGQESVDNTYTSIYGYLWENKDIIPKKTKQIYYIALGRERWGTYKVENPSNITTILNSMIIGE